MRSEPAVLRPAALATAVAVALVLAACGGGSSGDDGLFPRLDDQPSDTRDGVLVDGSRYPLVAAIGEIWGTRGDWPSHFNVRFTVTDGRFAVTPIVIDGQDGSVRRPVQARAVLRADLYAPGARSFTFTTYTHLADPNVPGAADGVHFFTGGQLGVDMNGNGDVEHEEMRDIVGGQIEFTGPVADISLDFSLVLEDGVSASGRYDGLFEFVQIP